MPIAEGITAAKGAFEVGKIALDLLRHSNIDVGAVQGRLLELQGLILSAQAALGEAREENRRLTAQVEELKEEQRIRASVIHAQNAYWIRHVNGKLDGPFCTACWDDGKKLVRMAHTHDSKDTTQGTIRVFMCHFHDRMILKLNAKLFDESGTIS